MKTETGYKRNNVILNGNTYFVCAVKIQELKGTKIFLILRRDIPTGVNTLRTGLLNCLNARSRGLIQSEVRFL